MIKNHPYYWYALLLSMCLISCTDDNSSYISIESDPASPVVFNFNDVPYQTLSEYNFYEGDLKDLNPVYGVLPYDLNSTLFTDYAKKKRFIWMPEGVQSSYIDDHSVLDFPVGTVLIKNFYYENVLPDNSTKIIETRLMFKLDDSWSFANYVWNDEQTEAFFTTQSSAVNIDWIENSEVRTVNYQVPRLALCFTCHKISGTAIPIGPKPQNLNRFFQYSDENVNQLSKWVDYGYLNGDLPQTITSTVDWTDSSQSLDLRARSYLDINCAHCHSDNTHCGYANMRLGFGDYIDPSSLGVCVENDFGVDENISHIITSGNANNSALFFRMNTNEEQFRMPIIGRTLIHEDANLLIQQWINSLNTNCN